MEPPSSQPTLASVKVTKQSCSGWPPTLSLPALVSGLLGLQVYTAIAAKIAFLYKRMLAVERILFYRGRERERKILEISLSLTFKCSFSQFVQFKVVHGEGCGWAHLEGPEPR